MFPPEIVYFPMFLNLAAIVTNVQIENTDTGLAISFLVTLTDSQKIVE